jgi:hypothetical protein
MKAPRRASPRKAHAFTYRCPGHLIGPLDEARFLLREPSRAALISKAIAEYLRARGLVRA